MNLDLVERRILFSVFPISFLAFLFFPFHLVIKILYFSLFVFFLIFFTLTTLWAREAHPERKFIIGFLVTVFHTFIFFLSGVLGGALAFVVLKIFPDLLQYLRGIF